MAIFEGALAHVLTAVLGGALLEGWRFAAKQVRERRPLTKLFPFDKSKKVWIVLSEVPAYEEGEFFNKASPIDGVYSFDDLSDYLRKIGLSRQQFDTRFSSDLTMPQCEDDLILIGGYENNNVSKMMNDLYRGKRSYFLENNMIKEGGRKRRSWGVVLDTNRRITKDYCLVTKIRNPFCPEDNRKSWILAFEGVRQFGTLGAVRHWNEKIFKEFRQVGLKVKRSDELEVVVEIDVDYQTGYPQVNWGGIVSAYLRGSEVK